MTEPRRRVAGAASQHLRVLEAAGLVTARRAGTRRLYRIEPRGVRALRYLDGFWGDARTRSPPRPETER